MCAFLGSNFLVRDGSGTFAIEGNGCVVSDAIVFDMMTGEIWKGVEGKREGRRRERGEGAFINEMVEGRWGSTSARPGGGEAPFRAGSVSGRM